MASSLPVCLILDIDVRLVTVSLDYSLEKDAKGMTDKVSCRVFDADNHHYEPVYPFERYVESRLDTTTETTQQLMRDNGFRLVGLSA